MFKFKLPYIPGLIIMTLLIIGLTEKKALAQFETQWQESHSGDNFPDWFNENNYPRSGGFGLIDGDEVFVAAMRESVRLIDAENGSFITELPFLGSGGHFNVNTAGITEDGKIMGSALRLDVSAAPFNVHLWEDTESDIENVISYEGSIDHRLGDVVTYTGSMEDGTAMVIAANNATSVSPHIYVWEMDGDTFAAEPLIIQVNENELNGDVGNTNSAYPVGDDLWLYNARGITPALVNGNGEVIASAQENVVSFDSHNIKIFGEHEDGTFYFVTFVPNDSEEDKSLGQLVYVPEGNLENAETIDETPSLGDESSLTNNGVVDIHYNEDEQQVDVFVMDASNGLGRYNLEVETAVSVDDDFITSIPDQVGLSQNYPNPFNPTTSIQFNIPKQSHIELTVHNMLGQQVATVVNETMSGGMHEVVFNADNLSSGVYLYKLRVNDQIVTNQMTLIK